jgi:YHS domain-containing protein
MTAQRQEGNGSRAAIEFRPGIAFILLLAGLVLSSAGAQGISGLVAQAATTERVIVSRYSGLAIEGFDPVAYFVDARPVAGLPEFEASEGGAVWRFHNEGNRASFVAHPEIYGPQFGGYDPIDLGRGVTFAGNPRFWLIAGQRLYLFGREENRDTFAADPERFLRAATSRWPQLERNLAQ